MVRLPDDRLRRPERLAVIGAGYIGLPTAAGFADLGYEVVCADTNHNKLAAMASGVVAPYFFESSASKPKVA